MATKTTLLSKKLFSLLQKPLAFSLTKNWFCRRYSKTWEPTTTKAMKTKKAGPMFDLEKACTELSTPERVMKVPKIERAKVPMINIRFQNFREFRFSWTITECKKAVPVNQGIKEA